MSVPQKFRAVGDFHEYYSGARKAPYLTLFIGGNHEASSHLQELYYGGWVAPKIYYLGAANVVRFGDLRIAGLSGIWKGYNYNKPHFERLPYSQDEIKSLYHVREIDVRKLLLLRTQVDVGLSHDWPRSIEWRGDWKALFRKKDLFEADSRAGTLGSSAAKYVLDRLRPQYWFSAHLHCKFAAVVEHGNDADLAAYNGLHTDSGAHKELNGTKNEAEINIDLEDVQPTEPTKNADEIDLDMDDEDEPAIPSNTAAPAATSTLKQPDSSDVPSDIRSQLPLSFTRPQTPSREKQSAPPPPPAISNKHTQFLALDKCLPNRKFLQILNIDPLSSTAPATPSKLAYDKEWLAILRVFASSDPHEPNPANIGESMYGPLIDKEEEWVEENLVKQGKMDIPENFDITAPLYDGKAIGSVGREQPKEYSSSQMKAFCQMLGIPNWFDSTEEERQERWRNKTAANESERTSGGSRGGGRGGGRGNRRGGGGRSGGRGRGRVFR